MAYKSRLGAPGATNKNWMHVSYGGYNSCILIANTSCLPNCVGYAWGRWRELLGSTPHLSRGNAEMWYGTADGYARGKTPRLGAVVCWSKGAVGNSSDGAGHVAVVEGINPDGSILISESGYKSFRFRTRTLSRPYEIGGTYSFQGFIYNPIVMEKTYKTTKTMNFRSTPDLKGSVIGNIPANKYLTGIVDSNGWLKTKYDGKEGYVRQKGETIYCELI